MEYVSRDTARVAVVGLIAIAAIALGAATIQTTVDQGTASAIIGTGGFGSDNPGTGTGGPTGNITDGEIVGNTSTTGIVAELSTCVDPLAAWYGTALYFGLVVAFLYGVKRRYSTGTSMLAMYAVAPVVLTAYFLSTDCASAGGGSGGGGSIAEGIGDMAGESIVPTDVPPVVILAVFGVALIATVLVVYRASGDQYVAGSEVVDEDEADEPHVSDLAAAAGAAADRLEKHNADVDNEVYRAWWEMTSLLRVSKPGSATPGEFAEAAVEVGLDEDDVAQLTQLFEEVRYGQRDPESREERALAVFRSIEEAYGDQTDDTTGGDE